MLWTWWHANISANDRFKADFTAALRSVTARAIVMPGQTDLYFRVRDNEIEVAEMPNAELRPISSSWGHATRLGVNGLDNEFIDKALNELLAGEGPSPRRRRPPFTPAVAVCWRGDI
jgi:homoserine O-acetyltransferase